MAFTMLRSVQFSSVTQSCLTLCNLMNHSMLGLPVHHQLLEYTQSHVHWVGDAIQASHPLSSPSPPALNLFKHQGLFQWVSSSHQVAKVLEFQLQHQTFSIEHPGTISFLMHWLDILAIQGTLKTLLQHYNLKASLLRLSATVYGPALTSIHDYWKNCSFDCMDFYQQSDISAF